MENFRKKVSSLPLVALTTMLVGACATTPSHYATGKTQFGANAPDAIVVIGVKSAAPTQTWLGDYHRAFKMTWTRTARSIAQYPGAAEFVIDNADRQLFIFRDSFQEDMTWHVVRVPAGTYMLREIYTNVGKDHFTTQQSENINTPFFSLNPGEVRYIGDLHCNVASFPAKCGKLTRNDEPAKAALAKLPGITVKPFFREPAYIPAAGQSARLMPVSD